MKRVSLITFLTLAVLLFYSPPADSAVLEQNLLLIAGQQAARAEGDLYHRAVFYLEIPPQVTGTIYVRIFDADLGGSHDNWRDGSEAYYHLYGKGGLNWNLRSILDPVGARTPLADLRLGVSKYYDDQWRTIAALDVNDADLKNDTRYFQLVVDGVKGAAINRYQVFVSAQEKENQPIDGLRILSPSVTLHLPAAPGLATQVRFTIPADADYLKIFNFDAEQREKGTTLFFETPFARHIPITDSKDAQVTFTKIDLTAEDKGNPGAIVIHNPKSGNYLQVWITDQQDQPILLSLPVFTAPENHLPLPAFTSMPLSECLAVVLDASGSTDPDLDEMAYAWEFSDGRRAEGRRIVQQFPQAGTYTATLTVSDKSGFVANSSQLSQTIHINQPPVAVIQAPDKGVPLRNLTFDASASRDADGTIRSYLWNFGDGSKEQGVTVKHQYGRSGRYQVTLLVEDDSQSLCTQGRATQWIWINTPPVPQLNARAIGAVGETLEFTAEGSVDSDGEIVAYQWDFGDQTTGEGETVSHQWTQPGTYTVHLRVTDDAGLSNSSVEERTQLIINAPPIPQAAYEKIIAAQTETLFDASASIDPDGTIRNYIWDMGDGAVLNGVQVRHSYVEPGVKTIKLTVTDNTDTLNNTVAATFTVRVNYPPVPMAGEDQLVNDSLVFFDAGASSDADDPIIAYHWDFGDGQQAQGASVSHVYALPGTYTATLTVTDASGTPSAIQTDTVDITINDPPIADAGGPQIISIGDTVSFDGSFSTDPDGEIVSYEWDVADGVILDGAEVAHQYTQAGSYQVRLTVRDNAGAENSDYTIVTVNAPPVANFDPFPRIAPGQTVEFNGTSSYDPDGKIQYASWDFGDATPVTAGLSAQHVFTGAGRYPVTLTVRDNSPATQNTATMTRIIAVNYPPVAQAGEDIHTCGQMVTLDASQSTDADGDVLIYTWDFGDGQQGQGQRVAHQYLSPGIYPVRLTVDDGQNVKNSIASDSLRVFVNAPPEAQLRINSAKVCAGEFVLFDGGASRDPEKGLLRYWWDLGDGPPQAGVNPAHEYKTGGYYRIRLKVTDDSNLACNTSEAETMLQVIDAPIADAGPDIIACANRVTQFDGSKSTGGGRHIKSYEWDFGDEQSGVGVNAAHVYAKPGEYQARLVITVAGEGQCANVSEDEITVNVLAAPVAAFEVVPAACPAEDVVFNGAASQAPQGTLTGHAWDFGDKTSANGVQATHQYAAPGAYTATLQVTSDAEGNCNVSEASRPIIINASPTAVIQVSAADESPVSGEEYTTDPHTLLRFSGAQSHDADGHIQAYAWDFGDGQQATGPFVSHQFQQPGTYVVSLQVNDNSNTRCHAHTSTMRVQVRKPLAQEIQGAAATCVGQAVEYSVETAEPVTWFLNDGTSGNGARLTKTFEKPGLYQLRAQVGQDWMPVKTITVWPIPEITLPKTIEVFLHDPVVIRPIYERLASPALRFGWEMGDGAKLTEEIVQYTYSQAGKFTVVLSVTSADDLECLRRQYRIPVIVHAPPVVEILAQPEQVFTGGARDTVQFEAQTKDIQENWLFAWDFGDDGQAIGKVVSHLYKKSGVFTVTVTVSDPRQRTTQTYQFSKKIEVQPRK